MKIRRILAVAASLCLTIGLANAQDDKAGSIRHTSDAITIDGKADEAAWVSANEYNDFFHAASEPPDDDADLSCRWKALWDEENLYFWAEVTDEAIVTGDNNDWQDDSIELYLDADALGKVDEDPVTTYADGENLVYQLTILAGEDLIYNGINHAKWVEVHPTAEFDGENKAPIGGVGTVGAPGYSIEIAIPWSSLTEGSPDAILDRGVFGLGVAVNDDDDEGGRDSQIMWATDNGDLWQDATMFPPVELLVPEGPGPDIFVKRTIDLGELPLDQPSFDNVLAIRNVGTDNALSISNVSVSGPDADRVTIGDFPATLAPGADGEISYTFTPGRTGAFSFSIDIESDDVDEEDRARSTEVTAAVINFAGPIAHFDLDEAADSTDMLDISGNGNSGAYDGVTLGGDALATGSSGTFNGTSFGSFVSDDLGGNKFSFSMWVNASGLGGTQLVFGQGVGSPLFGLILQDGTLSWFADGDFDFMSDATIPENETHHLAASYDDNEGNPIVVLYFDGVEVARKEGAVTLDPDIDPWYIGSFEGGLGFSGRIDDVQVYSRVLTADEVKGIYDTPGVDGVPGSIEGGELPEWALGPDGAAGDAGLAGYYWRLEPKAVPTSGEPLHRSGDGPDGTAGENSGWADENLFNTPARGSFSATAFDYGGNDLTPISEWLRGDAGSFSDAGGELEANLDDGVFRMVGYIQVNVPGERTFSTTSDDGSVVYIGPDLVISNDNGHGNQTVENTYDFPAAGFYPIDVRYFNGDWLNEAGTEHGGANFIGEAGFENFVQSVDGMVPWEPVGGLTNLDLLVLGADDNGEAGADANVLAFLRERFTSVRYMNSGATDGSETADVIVMSSTFGSGSVRGKFHNSAVPIVNWEEAIMDSGDGEFGQSLATMTKSTDTVQMTLGDHPIAGALAGTTIDYLTAAGAETLGSSELSAGTTAVGTAADGSNDGLPMLFVTDTGGEVGAGSGVDGAASPARRVAFPMTDATFDSLTDDGKLLLENSILWAAGIIGGEPAPIDGLLGYWRFNEGSGGTVADSSGNGNDGTIIAPDGAWVEDPALGSVYQSGGGSYVDFGTILPVIGVDTDFTWSFWVNADETDNNNIVFGNRWSPDGTDFAPREFIKFTPRVFEWHFNGGGENVPGDNSMFVVGEWAHNLVVKSGSTLTYYRNGAEIASSEITGAPANAQPLYLGGQNGAENFSGKFDEVAVFNRALSVDEVAEVYARGQNGESLGSGSGPGPDGLPPITNVGVDGDGNVSFNVPDGVTADIQYSVDLLEWETIANGITGPYNDTDATRRARPAGFYRAAQ